MRNYFRAFALMCVISLMSAADVSAAKPNALVLMTDFGLADGAVSEVKGVAFSVNSQLPIFDITHEIPPFNIWAAAYRLKQTYSYWPKGTVFVSVVDPGVGSDRKPVIVRTKSGRYIIAPDNGTLTFIKDDIDAIRIIDDKKQRLKGSEASHTFHGRDLFGYVGARLATGIVRFEDLGPSSDKGPVLIPFQQGEERNGVLFGNIPVLDPNYGNVWSNISLELFQKTFKDVAPSTQFFVRILHNREVKFSGKVPFARSFSQVKQGEPLLYVNSLLNLALAINQGNFAKQNQIESGGDWSLEVSAVH